MGSAPFLGREVGPHVTQCRLGRGLCILNGILIHPAVWAQLAWAENWGGLCPSFLEKGSWVPIYRSVAWADAYLCTKWHLNPCSRLATIDMGRKFGAPPLLGRGLGPHLTQTRLGLGLPPYLSLIHI